MRAVPPHQAGSRARQTVFCFRCAAWARLYQVDIPSSIAQATCCDLQRVARPGIAVNLRGTNGATARRSSRHVNATTMAFGPDGTSTCRQYSRAVYDRRRRVARAVRRTSGRMRHGSRRRGLDVRRRITWKHFQGHDGRDRVPRRCGERSGVSRGESPWGELFVSATTLGYYITLSDRPEARYVRADTLGRRKGWPSRPDGRSTSAMRWRGRGCVSVPVSRASRPSCPGTLGA